LPGRGRRRQTAAEGPGPPHDWQHSKILPTRRTAYGIRVLILLAGGVIPFAKAAEIGEAMNIPTGYLHQVLREIRRCRLVTSRSGPTGCYPLAESPGLITILEIAEALDGPVKAQECALRGGPCHWGEECALHSVTSATATLTDPLAASTLAQRPQTTALYWRARRRCRLMPEHHNLDCEPFSLPPT
jgi:Rrf2 family protein